MTGWRAIALIGTALIAVVLAAIVFAWIAVAVALVVALGVAHVLYVPRLARWLGIGQPALVALSLPVLAAVGLALGGQGGAVAAVAIWFAVFGAPHLVLRHLAGRLRTSISFRPVVSAGDAGRYPALRGVACARCGRVYAPLPGDTTCPGCGAVAGG